MVGKTPRIYRIRPREATRCIRCSPSRESRNGVSDLDIGSTILYISSRDFFEWSTAYRVVRLKVQTHGGTTAGKGRRYACVYIALGENPLTSRVCTGGGSNSFFPPNVLRRHSVFFCLRRRCPAPRNHETLSTVPSMPPGSAAARCFPVSRTGKRGRSIRRPLRCPFDRAGVPSALFPRPHDHGGSDGISRCGL